ncbi:MAG TPA: DUF4232 domain-containing protein [Acidimicrobiales bacterium]|nr:DUF4232 domain-containing protein [Acidimicrobiales bacterium]
MDSRGRSRARRASLAAALLAAGALVLAGLGASVAAASAGASATSVAPCRGAQLIGNFSIVRGSEGAGNVVYALELINRSATTCSVSGLPHMQLLGAAHARLPTHVRFAGIGSATAVLVVLRHGQPAWASARFSPDVPGVGEQTTGPCERTATSVRVTEATASSAVVVPVRPPTAVCEHGTMSLTLLSRHRPTSSSP